MKILKEGFVYLSASVIQKAIPFLLLPFLTRVLSTEEYGVVAIFMVTASIYSLFIGASLNGFLRVIYHKSSSAEFIGYIGNSLIFFIILSLAIYVITWLFESSFSELLKLKSHYLYIALFTACAKFMFDMRLVIFQTMRQAFNFAKLQLTLPVIETLLVIFLVLYLYRGAEGRIFSFVVASVLTGVIAIYLMYREKLLYISFNLSYFKRIARHILPLLPHSIALTALATVDKLILSSTIGFSIVGELSVALSLALPIWILAESINTAFMPWSFEKFHEGKLDMIVGATYLLLIGLFLVAILYSILLFFTFDLIVGDAFRNVLYPTLILVWVGWFKLAYYCVIKGVVFSENTNYLPIISIIAGFIYLGLIYFNIDVLTLIDISIYMNVLHIVMLVCVFFLSQIKYPQPWGNFQSINVLITVLKKRILS